MSDPRIIPAEEFEEFERQARQQNLPLTLRLIEHGKALAEQVSEWKATAAFREERENINAREVTRLQNIIEGDVCGVPKLTEQDQEDLDRAYRGFRAAIEGVMARREGAAWHEGKRYARLNGADRRLSP